MPPNARVRRAALHLARDQRGRVGHRFVRCIVHSRSLPSSFKTLTPRPASCPVLNAGTASSSCRATAAGVLLALRPVSPEHGISKFSPRCRPAGRGAAGRRGQPHLPRRGLCQADGAQSRSKSRRVVLGLSARGCRCNTFAWAASDEGAEPPAEERRAGWWFRGRLRPVLAPGLSDAEAGSAAAR